MELSPGLLAVPGEEASGGGRGSGVWTRRGTSSRVDLRSDWRLMLLEQTCQMRPGGPQVQVATALLTGAFLPVLDCHQRLEVRPVSQKNQNPAQDGEAGVVQARNVTQTLHLVL